jgi:hypothetical protein
MPIAKFQMPDGKIARFEVPEGTTPEQAQAQITQMVAGGLPEQPQVPAQPAPAQQAARVQPEVPVQAPQVAGVPAPEQAPEEPAALDQLRQKIIENPAGATVAEFGSAVSRGAVNLLDFFGPKAINSALELAGVEARIPEIAETEIGKAATTGQFMESGLARKAVRTAGEMVAPTLAGGQVLRTAAQAIPATAIPTTTQRVVQAAAAPVSTETAAAVLSGAGREVGGELGEAVAGETGRQVGELAGGILAPVGGALAKESGKLLITKGAKKLLSETAPTIEGLKTAARGVYKEIDELGVTINPSAVNKLAAGLRSQVRDKGYSPGIHPKIKSALKEFDDVAGQSQTTSELDRLRRVAGAAAKSQDPDEARLGNMMVNRIDDFMDNIGKAELSKTSKDIGAKYRDARQLWRRVKKSEQLDEAWKNAELSPAGFENGIRQQFRSILKSKKQRKGFTPEELKAMRGVVEGGTIRNFSEKLGMLGIDEKRVSGALMPLMGAGAGAFAYSGPGAIIVPIIGTVSKKLGLRLAKNAGRGADIVVRAGKNGPDVVKAYMKITPPKQRDPKELTELLLRPDISLEGLKKAAKYAPANQMKLINDAAFLVNAIKSGQDKEQQQ